MNLIIGRFCVVRTYSAGVHMGIVVETADTAAMLKDARRLHRWRGANTLNEVALHGVDKEYSHISEAVPVILLTQVIEIIPTTEVARRNLEESRWPT